MFNIRNFLSSNPMAALATAGAAGFVSGFAVSHLITRSNGFPAHFSEETDKIEEPDNGQLQFVFEDHDFKEPMMLNQRRDPSEIKVLPVETVELDDVVESDDVVVMSSIFHSKDTNWNWDDESLKRKSSDVFTIHREEYFNQESGYNQTTLTYYAGDDILVDEQEVPIYNHKAIVGDLEFGHGSDDPNVVYVRNNRLKGEYEVIKDEGLYQVEVLGQDIEKSFSAKDGRQPIQKFRDE